MQGRQTREDTRIAAWTRRQRYRDHDELIDAVLRSLRALPAIGAGLIGASAIATIVGAFYLQAFLEALGAGWAMDFVPYATMLRTGALAISLVTLATIFCLIWAARHPGGWVVNSKVFWGVMVAVLAVLMLRSVNPAWAAAGKRILDITLPFGVSLLFGMVATLVISTRPRNAEHRSIAVGFGVILVLSALFVLPWQQGQLDAMGLLNNGPTQSHPLACAGDDATPWHLVRPMGTSVLLARISDHHLSTVRLAAGESVVILGAASPAAPCPASRH
ncbi:hypothetical protein FIV34_11875 [Luteibacter pinisoli]|uniref:Uncharacterized protein n=1 Tax=Luteibacter pinisoli TaxID=2589080 RepID=A0A4Y5Z6J4_9GAMM|nr:hypothetical protein [Luteibacter pinisoli]QDE39858.1 hypothetical protein FIV34_11875 [Luteibacter pinisoli]